LHVYVTARDGTVLTLRGRPGDSLMQTIRDGGGDLLALCGGSCSCATCHVYVDPESWSRVGEPGDYEKQLLDSSEHRTAHSRLSCQVTLVDDLDVLRVALAPTD
jgi:ferredoxin, 2Fe-2S